MGKQQQEYYTIFINPSPATARYNNPITPHPIKRKMELLAPSGDVDSIKAAITAGADAVYCGLNKFNARDRATNIDFEDLNGILNFAHRNTCKVFLTLNIMVVGSEIITYEKQRQNSRNHKFHRSICAGGPNKAI